jgi:hypothetical protein
VTGAGTASDRRRIAGDIPRCDQPNRTGGAPDRPPVPSRRNAP